MRKIAMFLAIGLTLFTLAGCSATDEEVAYVQSVATICGLGPVGMTSTYAGVVSPQGETEIQKSEGEAVRELLVKVGETVQKEQVLFTYDTDQVQLNIEKGKVELQQLKNTVAAKQKEKALLEKEKASAGADMQLQYTLEIQEADATILETQYNISLKEKEIEKMNETLGKLEVKSPVDGVVQSINENGETDEYGNPKPYMTIMETGTYRIKGYVNEMNVAYVSEGMPVVIHSRTDDTTWSGSVSKVDLDNPAKQENMMYMESSKDETVNSSKYAFYVELEEDKGLMMGQHVYLELGAMQMTEDAGNLELPSYYLNDVDASPWVWAQNSKGALEKREVTLGSYIEEMDSYVIESGLDVTDYIAFPEEMLKEGMSCVMYDDMMGGMSDDVMEEMPEDMEVEE